MEELWKVHPIYPNYRVSNLGHVEYFNKISRRWTPKKLKILNKGQGVRRYVAFNAGLGARDRRKTLKVHQVVAELFIGPCPPGMIVMHRDHDGTNNTIMNLEYGTHSQNVLASFRDGRYSRLP